MERLKEAQRQIERDKEGLKENRQIEKGAKREMERNKETQREE